MPSPRSIPTSFDERPASDSIKYPARLLWLQTSFTLAYLNTGSLTALEYRFLPPETASELAFPVLSQ